MNLIVWQVWVANFISAVVPIDFAPTLHPFSDSFLSISRKKIYNHLSYSTDLSRHVNGFFIMCIWLRGRERAGDYDWKETLNISSICLLQASAIALHSVILTQKLPCHPSYLVSPLLFPILASSETHGHNVSFEWSRLVSFRRDLYEI